ncbi:MAG TPA: tetratricopeptide repeat protein [Chitinophagales bacterium]|nr:tetratricopeptide repeat protein [Chitinophagales bacterium]
MKQQKKARPPVAKQKSKGGTNTNPSLQKWMGIICACFAFLLYANTLNHQFALDDFTTIYGNTLTTTGIKGIPMLLHTAYWYGIDGKNDWLYRPFSMVMFALEWQLAPNTPALGHWINVLMYALTAFILFRFLSNLFENFNVIIPLAVSLLWIAHPIHTEVVANIKSRDELLAFLFSILTMWECLKYVKVPKMKNLILAGVYFFLALMAKESPITFVVIIPMTLFVFTNSDFKKIGVTMIPVAVSATIYLAIRGAVLTSQTGGTDIPLIDNSLVAAHDFIHREATAFYVLGLYIKLLFFPHPMSSDYSFHQIPVVGFDNPVALGSLIIYIALGAFGLMRLLKKDPVGYGILFYLIGIALVANVLFLTRSTMADRFLYSPSLGFSIVLVFLLARIFRLDIKTKTNFNSLSRVFSFSKNLSVLIVILLVASAFKAWARNRDWKNDTTIFSADAKHSPNSARIHFLYGNHMLQELKENKVASAHQQEYYRIALEEFQKAIDLHPTYEESYVGMGEAYAYKKDFAGAINWFKKTIESKPKFAAGYNNLGNTYFKMQQYDSAILYLQKAIAINPSYVDAYNNIGSSYFSKGNYQDAINSFKKAIEISPQFVAAYKNLGSAYGMMKQYDESILYFHKALDITPNDASINYFLGLSYQFKGDMEHANLYLNKAYELDPKLKK